MTLEGWCSARNYEEMVGEAWDRLRIRTKSHGIWAPSWVLAKKPNELNKCIVSFNLHLHLELLMCQSSCTHITLVMDSWSSLIQGHLIKFLSLKSESLKLWQISSIRPTVFLVLPSYHLASSCGGSVELAASFHVVKIVFSHLVMSGTLPTWRFSWSKTFIIVKWWMGYGWTMRRNQVNHRKTTRIRVLRHGFAHGLCLPTNGRWAVSWKR